MAETETENEHTLPTKRKPDDDPIPENNQEQDNHSNKSQKLESPTNNPPIIQEKNTDNAQTLEPSMDNQNGTEDEEEEEEDGDYEDEEENGEEVVVDRKGKGILIEEDEDDSDDDGSSGDGSELEGGDDSEEAEEDDPLAEVDLDNILPSRTRRKVVHPGVYIANDNLANEDDNSDDSDA
ncbi:unnamed protein product [Dovyalis caffra]|uniref:Histone chaperone domain-containing protein n=1 Tax=Dovyalis caffra TaxID=77055 RepID=A0AAV1R5V9_9ROSI|nr:unnamed protein product [Dovyalis caffra]